MRNTPLKKIGIAVYLLLCGLTAFAQTPTTPGEPAPGSVRPVVPVTGKAPGGTPSSAPAAGAPAAGAPAAGAPAAGAPAAGAPVKPRVLKSIFGAVATDSVPVGPNSSRQKVDLPAPAGDSIRVGDSVLTPGGDSLAQGADTVQLSAKQNAAIHKIIPRKATIRSLIFPGLGQAYNRQYYKMPFVYAGFAVIFYDIIHFTGNYNRYLTAYRNAYNLPDVLNAGTTYPNGLSYKNALVDGKAYAITQLKQGSDFWRRNRDLNIILGVLLWGLQAVEANVAAHLKTFDISDNISANWKPVLFPSPVGIAPGVRLTFNFKH